MPRKKFGRNRKNRCRFLHSGGLPSAGVCRLQGRRPAQEAVHQPEQDVLPQAQRKLRGLPASRQRGRQACPVHGAAPLRRRVIPVVTRSRTVGALPDGTRRHGGARVRPSSAAPTVWARSGWRRFGAGLAAAACAPLHRVLRRSSGTPGTGPRGSHTAGPGDPPATRAWRRLIRPR